MQMKLYTRIVYGWHVATMIHVSHAQWTLLWWSMWRPAARIRNFLYSFEMSLILFQIEFANKNIGQHRCSWKSSKQQMMSGLAMPMGYSATKIPSLSTGNREKCQGRQSQYVYLFIAYWIRTKHHSPGGLYRTGTRMHEIIESKNKKNSSSFID